MNPFFKLELPDADATAAFARRLADRLRPWSGGVIYLRGSLGAGKTTIARELLRSFGVTGTIRSPTYTLIESYELADRRLLHMDLYRIEGADLEQLGLIDYPPDQTLWLVEWPEKAQGLLPPPDLDLSLEPLGEGRSLSLTCHRPIDWPLLAAP